ncbi:MAG TPA: hypothetical protein VHV82_01930 [Sporichthyaceae bacterium]|jgi:hypothetical protein|nr:hypothetical protein [Sporichthyaceae bacterium]
MHDLVASLVTAILFAAGGGGAAGPVAPAQSGPTPAQAQSSTGSGPTARQVTEHLCNTYDYRPARMTVACGDGNAEVVRLHWSEWTTARAVGFGTWRQNDCEPYCAAGKFHDYPVRVALTEPMHTGPRRFFGRVIVNFPSKAPPVPAFRSGHAVLMNNGRDPDQVLRPRHRGKPARGLAHHHGRPRTGRSLAAQAGDTGAGGHRGAAHRPPRSTAPDPNNPADR